jgi:ectoine hydroxylase-related dioxygenase (phytanoyl-CoA dioxygenase family)
MQTVAEILDCKDLSRLHTTLDKQYDVFKREEDQSSIFHKKVYGNYDRIIPIYKHLVRDVVRPLFSEAIVYQKAPSFRVHLPNNLAVGTFHKDKDFGHPDVEINFLIPLTKMWGTNSTWIESEEDEGDYQPIESEPGYITMFNGANCKHGNHLNRTDYTRVSMDFRVISQSSYEPSTNGSINTNLKFRVGEYYEIIQ